MSYGWLGKELRRERPTPNSSPTGPGIASSEWLTVGGQSYIVVGSGSKGRGPDATEDGAE